jgi:hypothetical protein
MFEMNTKTLAKVASGALAVVMVALAFEGAAAAQTLPDPELFRDWLDFECFTPDAAAQKTISQSVSIKPIDSSITLPILPVVSGTLQELCVPVQKNRNVTGAKTPPADVLQFEQYADLACYSVQGGANTHDQLGLTQLNPEVRRLIPGFPEETVTLGAPQQVCLPVAKNPDQFPIPANVQRLVQGMNFECFSITGPQLNVPLTLSQLNPALASVPDATVGVLSPSQACVPVLTNNALLPADVNAIVSGIFIKKYQMPQPPPNLAVSLTLHQLNPAFASVPDVQVQTLSPSELGLPVRKEAATMNIQFVNTTAQQATDLEITLQGRQIPQTFFNGPFNSFSQTPTASGDWLLHWTTPNLAIAPGQTADVGFSVLGAGNILSATWTSNNTVIGCATVTQTSGALQIGSTGSVTFSNSVLGCESVPLFVGGLSVEWYASASTLLQMQPIFFRHPISVTSIPDPLTPTAIAPGGSINVPIPAPPRGAHFALIVHKVSKSADLSNATVNIVQVQLQPDGPIEVPAVSGWPLAAMAALLLAVAAWMARRVRSNAFS